VVNALPGGTEKPIVDAVFAEFKARYHAHCNYTTLPFPGVIDMLKALKGAGIKVAVNSNKLDQDSRTLVDIHFPGLVSVNVVLVVLIWAQLFHFLFCIGIPPLYQTAGKPIGAWRRKHGEEAYGKRRQNHSSHHRLTRLDLPLQKVCKCHKQ
jgi:hypothetical protein